MSHGFPCYCYGCAVGVCATQPAASAAHPDWAAHRIQAHTRLILLCLPRVAPSHAVCTPLLGAVLLGCRALAAGVELWVLRRYVLEMIRADVDGHNSSAPGQH